MKESFQIALGEKEYLSNGGMIEVKPLNPIQIDPNPSRASIAESKHVVLNVNNVIKASVKNADEGETQVLEFDPIQFAAHPEEGGDGHDRAVSIAQGSDYDRNSRIARSILIPKQNEVLYLAGYLEKRRRISGNEAKRILAKAGEGEDIEITITEPNGDQEKRRQKRKLGEIIIVDFTNGQNELAG